MTDIKTALDDLIGNRAMPLDEAADRHFSPHYRQRTNGTWDDRAGFLEHITHLREAVATISVEVLDELVDGRRYADRHVVTIRKRDGEQVVQEVYLFGDLDEHGRFERVEETTLMLSGAEADRSLGNAK